MPEKYLTATQVAEMLQLNVETVYDMVNDGELLATKVRGRWRFDESELREWFKTFRALGLQNVSRTGIPRARLNP